jgi:hydroxymethylpyrimidine/phosphomethylpyrimidine kinase
MKKEDSNKVKRILTIAGSDSGGGAGIQADLKAITVLGEYGLSVLTALTAQNTLGVQATYPIPPRMVEAQLKSVLTDIGVDAAKTGMLGTAAVVSVVARAVRTYRIAPVVVDPVMVAKDGSRLLSLPAITRLREELLPLATVVTPNLPEAEVLCGFPVRNVADMRRAAKAIITLGPKNVLIKGGHLSGPAVDLLYDGRSFKEFAAARQNNANTHGTGCSFSAALTTFLAQGYQLPEAVAQAKSFITVAITYGLAFGAGIGPVNPHAYVHKKHRVCTPTHRGGKR